MINDEFKAIKSQIGVQINDLSDIESILENQLIMVAAIPLDDNQYGQSKSKTPVVKKVSKPRQVPEALKHPTTQTEMLRARIRVFWLLRFLVLFLTRYEPDFNKAIKENPILLEQRAVESWIEGQQVTLGTQTSIDSVLCVIRLNQKMVVRHVLLDPEYFILVEVDQDDITKQKE
mmetsp:Transcript_37670/g.49572  ORF Transcript_37670/g.49572 Transcript_37670/m.49572 type:complete len:175 (+) Transcript_37670:831-1355(+)